MMTECYSALNHCAHKGLRPFLAQAVVEDGVCALEPLITVFLDLGWTSFSWNLLLSARLKNYGLVTTIVVLDPGGTSIRS